MRNPDDYSEKRKPLTRKELLLKSHLEERQRFGMIKNLAECDQKIEIEIGKKREAISPAFQYELECGTKVFALIKFGQYGKWLSAKKSWLVAATEAYLDVYHIVGKGRVCHYDRAKPDKRLREILMSGIIHRN